MRKAVYWSIVMILMAFVSCQESDNAARVGNHVVKIQEVRSALEGRRGKSETDLKAILAQVNSLIDQKLMFIGGVQAGLEQDSTILTSLGEFQDRQVYSYMIQKQVIDKTITPKMVRRKYEQQSREWHVQHIFMPLKRKQSPKKESIIKELTEIRSRILKGESFDAMARQFSKDSLSAGKGGDLGFLKWGDKNFGDAFFSSAAKLSKNQLSNVIESDAGFHLVKIVHLRSANQSSFKDAKGQLQRSFFRTKSSLLDSTFYSYVNDLKDKYNAVYIQENIDSLLILVKEKGKKQIIPAREPMTFLNSLSQEQQKMPLATYKGGTFTVEEMFKIYNRISSMRRPALGSVSAIQEFLDRNVPKALIIQEAYKKKVDKKAQVKKAASTEKEKIIAQRASIIFVDELVDVTEEELKDYYTEHLYKYEKDALVNVLEIRVADLETAQVIIEKANEGADFLALAETYHVKIGANSTNGKLGFIGANDFGAIGKRAVQMRVGEISTPIKEGAFYTVLKAVDRKSGTPASFELVKAKILRELNRNERSVLQTEWLQGIREHAPVTIFESALKHEFGITE